MLTHPRMREQCFLAIRSGCKIPYQNNYAFPQPGINNPGYYQQNPVIQPSNNIPNNQLTLKSLESMRERGLISEENYFKKLKELGY